MLFRSGIYLGNLRAAILSKRIEGRGGICDRVSVDCGLGAECEERTLAPKLLPLLLSSRGFSIVLRARCGWCGVIAEAELGSEGAWGWRFLPRELVFEVPAWICGCTYMSDPCHGGSKNQEWNCRNLKNPPEQRLFADVVRTRGRCCCWWWWWVQC